MEINNKEDSNGALRKRFIEPPFSIIDTRGGAVERKKAKMVRIGY